MLFCRFSARLCRAETSISILATQNKRREFSLHCQRAPTSFLLRPVCRDFLLGVNSKKVRVRNESWRNGVVCKNNERCFYKQRRWFQKQRRCVNFCCGRSWFGFPFAAEMFFGENRKLLDSCVMNVVVWSIYECCVISCALIYNIMYRGRRWGRDLSFVLENRLRVWQRRMMSMWRVCPCVDAILQLFCLSNKIFLRFMLHFDSFLVFLQRIPLWMRC